MWNIFSMTESHVSIACLSDFCERTCLKSRFRFRIIFVPSLLVLCWFVVPIYYIYACTYTVITRAALRESRTRDVASGHGTTCADEDIRTNIRFWWCGHGRAVVRCGKVQFRVVEVTFIAQMIEALRPGVCSTPALATGRTIPDPRQTIG